MQTLFIFIILILKNILNFFISNQKNYYKQKVKSNEECNHTFIPYTPRNKKPNWIKNGIIYLKVHLPKYGCQKIAISFNKKFAHTNITVSKSYVYNIIKANNYEIIEQRKELKNRVPKPMANNLIWSMDLTTIKEQQILGVIDNGSRVLLTLKYLQNKNTITIIRALLYTVEKYGKPKIIRSDNELVFTSKLMKIVLYILGIRQQTTQIASPWQNGRIERLFLTMKQSFTNLVFPTEKALKVGLTEFRFYYNHIRPHQHLNFKTPSEAWSSRPMATSKRHEPLYFSGLCGNIAGFYYQE
ncbi:MAG: integrase core domain-containing protein [Epsilonproteobacteria bacterium]|nr:integrase core domain-containing protein [Campylobacterota bacterium]